MAMSEKESIPTRTSLGTSKNGKTVWYDSESSHAATHIADTPGLEELAAEVTHSTELNEDYMQFHADMGRVVGTSDLVDIEPGDKVIYAKRRNRDNYSVFNMTKPPQPSSLVTVAYEIKDDGTYELVSTWIGPSDSPSFPGTERETPDSKAFWADHALAWGAQEIQPGTETEECPW
jgi:hypothetical protein